MIRICPTYRGYSVSDDGHVFSHRRRFGKGKGHGGGVRIDPTFNKELKVSLGYGGYLYTSISLKGKQRTIPIHRLIADAFISPCPEGLEVRHLNGNQLNNQPSNLAYGSKLDNANDRELHGHNLKGERHPNAKLKLSQVLFIRIAHNNGETIASLARVYKVAETTIRDIVQHKRWCHV